MIDAHCHLDDRFGGGWIHRPVGELLDVLDRAGVEMLVDLSGGWGIDTLRRHLDHFKAAAPHRFVMLGGVDWSTWPSLGPSFAASAARSLRSQLELGAAGLKVWKTLGLEARDERGDLVRIDDRRLDPIWEVCADSDVPVVIHVADPVDFFRPIGPDNPRSAELQRSPQWHWYRRVPVSFDDLIEQLDTLLGRWAEVSFVGAHMLDLFHAPERLDRMLRRHENLSVDLGARFAELSEFGPDVGPVVARHHRRVLYGVDHPPSVEMYTVTERDAVRVIESGMEIIGESIDSRRALVDVFQMNAVRIFGRGR